jgi:hypothetical protein
MSNPKTDDPLAGVSLREQDIIMRLLQTPRQKQKDAPKPMSGQGVGQRRRRERERRQRAIQANAGG